MSLSTWIVPPIAQCHLFGFDAVEITARKAFLIKEGKRIESAFYKPDDISMHANFGEWIEYIKKNSLEVVRSVYVEDSGGFELGMDAVTPVTFVFSNKIPKKSYTSFSLGYAAENAKVQAYIKDSPRVIMSKSELVKKLNELLRD